MSGVHVWSMSGVCVWSMSGVRASGAYCTYLQACPQYVRLECVWSVWQESGGVMSGAHVWSGGVHLTQKRQLFPACPPQGLPGYWQVRASVGDMCVQISRRGSRFWARNTHSMVVSIAMPELSAPAMAMAPSLPMLFALRLRSVKTAVNSTITRRTVGLSPPSFCASQKTTTCCTTSVTLHVTQDTC